MRRMRAQHTAAVAAAAAAGCCHRRVSIATRAGEGGGGARGRGLPSVLSDRRQAGREGGNAHTSTPTLQI